VAGGPAAEAAVLVTVRSAAGLAVSLTAGVVLLVTGSSTPGPHSPGLPPGRVSAAVAWPGAQRADFDPDLPDGPLLSPLRFLSTTTVLGTAPTPDASWVRLLLRSPSGVRELRRLPLGDNPQVEAVTTAGDDLVWTESTDRVPLRLWRASLSGGPATLLTASPGPALFYGNQYDLVIGDGQVHWATAAARSTDTDIRSVPLGGGRVTVRTEPGEWSMSAWPWLVDEKEGRLRDLVRYRDTKVVTSGPETVACTPVWCRVMVMNATGLARIDLMHPDGSARRRIAGANAQAAVTDIAVQDRFELLAEPTPDTDLTGMTTLLAYDASSGRTVEVAGGVSGAFTGGGVVWWSTGDDDSIRWHALDLRTV
jgi:hypothetical protein